MKILEVHYCTTWAGAERLVVDLCNELSKTNEVILCTIEDDTIPGKSYYRSELLKSVKYINLKCKSGNDVRGFYRLLKTISDVKPDIVHAHTDALSEILLQATLRGDADYVANALDAAHSEHTSILSYNDENSLACVISLAYFYARNDYHIHREFPTGKGYADLVLIPRKNINTPALVIELKYNRDAQAAINQIKARNYPQQLEDYSGDVMLVGINYDKETKMHECVIEKCCK